MGPGMFRCGGVGQGNAKNPVMFYGWVLSISVDEHNLSALLLRAEVPPDDPLVKEQSDE